MRNLVCMNSIPGAYIGNKHSLVIPVGFELDFFKKGDLELEGVVHSSRANNNMETKFSYVKEVRVGNFAIKLRFPNYMTFAKKIGNCMTRPRNTKSGWRVKCVSKQVLGCIGAKASTPAQILEVRDRYIDFLTALAITHIGWLEKDTFKAIDTFYVFTIQSDTVLAIRKDNDTLEFLGILTNEDIYYDRFHLIEEEEVE